jgi:hypothetical protein
VKGKIVSGTPDAVWFSDRSCRRVDEVVQQGALLVLGHRHAERSSDPHETRPRIFVTEDFDRDTIQDSEAWAVLKSVDYFTDEPF